MSQYFSEKYQNYYNKLSSSKGNNKYINLSSSNTISSVQSAIDSSEWKEQGLSYLTSNVLRDILDNCRTVEANITETLTKAQRTSYNSLLPKLEKFKEKDNEYTKLLETIAASDDESKKDYEDKKNKLESELKTYQGEVDSLIDEIKEYNEEIKEIKARGNVVYAGKNGNKLYEKDANGFLVEVGTVATNGAYVLSHTKVESASPTAKDVSSKLGYTKSKVVRLSTSTGGSTSSSSSSGKMKDLNILGGDWKVVDTSISVQDYYNHVKANGICQDTDPSIYGDYCLAFAYIHSSNMKNGNTSDGAGEASNYAHAGEFDTYITDNKSEMLGKVYEELNKGNPVILQVNGNSEGTCRHFVTVVGYKNTVTSAANLTEKDLLILDSWDGELERMDTDYSRFLTTGAQCGKEYSGYRLQVLKS